MSKAKGFYLLWICVGFSVLGSELTEFALGLWILARQSSSVMDYTLLFVFLELPLLVGTPWVGYWVDRLDRRKLLLGAEIGSGLLTGTLLIFDQTGLLALWGVYLFIAASSVFTGIQIECYHTLVFELVHPEKLKRANALGSFNDSLPQMICPLLGAFLFQQFGLSSVLQIDILTFALSSLASLLLLRVPFLLFSGHQGPSSPIRFLPDPQVWKRFLNTSQLRPLGIYTVFKNLFVALYMVTLVPFIIAAEAPVGVLMAVGGGAMTLVSVWLGIFPRWHRYLYLPLLDVVFSISIFSLAIFSGWFAWAGAIFLAFASLRISLIQVQTLWHQTVEAGLQGRVFAIRNLLKKLSALAGYLAAGWIIFAFSSVGGDGFREYYFFLGTLALLVLTGFHARMGGVFRKKQHPWIGME